MFDGPSFEDLFAPVDPSDMLGRARIQALRGTPNTQAAPQISNTARTASAAAATPRAQPKAAPQAAGQMPQAPGDPLLDQFKDLQQRQQQALGEVQQAYQPVDMTGMQDYARQRQEGGAQALFAAMAAQQAGKEFAPVSGALLRQAMAARDPMKVTGGMLTEQGQFLEDPGYRQNLDVQRADARLRQIDSMLQQNISAQERRRLQDDQQRAQQELRMLIASMKASSGSDKQAAANDRRVDSIRKEYNARLQKVQDGATFADAVINGLSAPGIDKNAPAQVAMVMQFGKMLDPDSVVREAEQRMIANARGLADSLMQMIPKIQSGAFLTREQLAQMRDVALQYQRGSHTRVDDLKAQYADLAQRNRLPAEDIVLGYGRGAGGGPPQGAVRERGAPQAAPAAGGPPPGAVREKGR